MPDLSAADKEFLNQLTVAIEHNISNEQFGVSELADQLSMSRSNLLRKVKKVTTISVNQLIREVRLKRSMDLLRTGGLNVSEVSHQVGFSSTSYFIKCFREYYGYPPGEVGKRDLSAAENETAPLPRQESKRPLWIWAMAGLILALAVGAGFYFWPEYNRDSGEKSIAVLPFKNDSNDSTNIYLINGLMESTLNNLQRIRDLKVISRTSTEKYRNMSRSIPEMARELDVRYFVEGSGQKIGDQILLNIQLIDGDNDKHLWAKQYRRETKDIFALQQEIAKNIADEIEAIITPEEEKQIEKIPTENLVAYDYFLKGKEKFRNGKQEGLKESIPFFEKAIEQDPKFALAYAELAFVYYYLDAFKTEQRYTAEINNNADKAMLYDPKSQNSLMAKAVYYIHNKQYQQAVLYLENALEYNPNSSDVLGLLTDMYNFNLPNTSRYLEYALRCVRLDIAGRDSSVTSLNYLRLANALAQNGFVDLSLKYIDKSLTFDPNNFYAHWVKSFVVYAKSKDFKDAKRILLEQLAKDTSNLILYEEIGKVCYMMRDYKEAYKYYKKFVELRERQQLDLFRHENLKLAFVLEKMGDHQKAEEYVQSFREFAESDSSMYGSLHRAAYYSYRNDLKNSLIHMQKFLKEDNYQYWILLIREDPSTDKCRKDPEFEKIVKAIEKKFWANHQKLKVTLEEKGVL